MRTPCESHASCEVERAKCTQTRSHLQNVLARAIATRDQADLFVTGLAEDFLRPEAIAQTEAELGLGTFAIVLP